MIAKHHPEVQMSRWPIHRRADIGDRARRGEKLHSAYEKRRESTADKAECRLLFDTFRNRRATKTAARRRSSSLDFFGALFIKQPTLLLKT